MKPCHTRRPLALLVFAAVACGGAARPEGPPGKHPPVRTTAPPLPAAAPGFYCREPHLAVDPQAPERVLLSAIFLGEVGKGDKARADARLLVWQSEDGGRSWSEPAAPFVVPGRPPTRIGADPVVAFGPGKALWIAGCDYDFPLMGKPGYQSIKVCRSGDGGKAWGPPVTVSEVDNEKGKGVVDKPWLAVDDTDGPRKGTAFVAWTRLDFSSKPARAELWCAALPSQARRLTPGVRLGEPIDCRHTSNAIHHVQLAIRRDGTLDVVWRQAPTNRLLHASSADGGKTFSKPAALSGDDKTGAGEFPSLCATPGGGLLAAWVSDGDVYCSLLGSGKWASPRPLAGELPAGARLSHPAVAATADALWALAYRWESEPGGVRVALYRSTGRGDKWEEHCTLASRRLPGARARAFSPGDYVGLAAAKGRVYAAYVLPGVGREGPRPRLYVSSVRQEGK